MGFIEIKGEGLEMVKLDTIEGKVAIIVDTTSYVLILPNFFIDFGFSI